MRKTPMTTEDFFNKICDILKEENLYPLELLDYGLGPIKPIELTNYEFEIKNNLNYGGNEGIYVDLYVYFKKENEEKYKNYDLGTFKTLNTDRDSFLQMAKLLGDFIYEGLKYLDDNCNDFEWEGYNVYPLKEDEKPGWGYCCTSLSNAIDRKNILLKSYPKILIRDNKTKKEKVYTA